MLAMIATTPQGMNHLMMILIVMSMLRNNRGDSNESQTKVGIMLSMLFMSPSNRYWIWFSEYCSRLPSLHLRILSNIFLKMFLFVNSTRLVIERYFTK